MKSIFIRPNNTIKDALKQLSKAGEKCLVVIEAGEKVLGTLSDGDVRRAILIGNNIDEPIQEIFNKNSTCLVQDQFTIEELHEIFLKNRFDLIPVVNKSGKVVEILTWNKVFQQERDSKNNNFHNIPVVIMAGGRGARLEPFTQVLPKALVPVQGKPIIEHIIARFSAMRCNEFYLMLNYKGKILKAYFEELQPSFNIHFFNEQEPLGTAGCLRDLYGLFNSPFFVSNCDIIIDTDYDSLYEFHMKNGYDVTLVASAREYVIPYGTCELNSEGHLSHITEKPKYNFLVNTGLYVMTPEVLRHIPKNKFCHMTHLIEIIKKQGGQVGVFPVDEDAWIDVGQWGEYRQAIEKL